MDDGELLRAKRVTKFREHDGTFLLEVVLTEGKKREVRRLCASLGIPVIRLARIEFGGLQLGDLPTGAWRPLDEYELRLLRDAKFASRKK